MHGIVKWRKAALKHARVEASRNSNQSTGFDIAVYILSGALLVILASAAFYGWKYGNVDESVAAGRIALIKDGLRLVTMDVDEDLSATINYYKGPIMKGKLVLSGAEEDSILFRLRNIKLDDKTDASDLVFFVRMPRSGLQGDFTGPWVFYYSRPSAGVTISEWALIESGNNAHVGWKAAANAIVTQRKMLLEWSEEWAWSKRGTDLVLESPK